MKYRKFYKVTLDGRRVPLGLVMNLIVNVRYWAGGAQKYGRK